jgi:hypothetical protein
LHPIAGTSLEYRDWSPPWASGVDGRAEANTTSKCGCMENVSEQVTQWLHEAFSNHVSRPQFLAVEKHVKTFLITVNRR